MQNAGRVTVLQKRLFLCCLYLSICNVPAQRKDSITLNGSFSELPFWSQMKSCPVRVGWENLVWNLPRLAGARLHGLRGAAAHFAHKPLESLGPDLRPLRGHLQERATGGRTACQLHLETREKTEQVASSSQAGPG